MNHQLVNVNPDRISLKRKIVIAGIEQYNKTIRDCKSSIDHMMVREPNEYGDVFETHSQFFITETTLELWLMNNQLQLANEELMALMRMPSYENKDHQFVEYGSVIKTESEFFFVSAGIERYFVDEIPVVGVSVYSSLYKMMKGKRVGELFSYGSRTYQIEDIF